MYGAKSLGVYVFRCSDIAYMNAYVIIHLLNFSRNGENIQDWRLCVLYIQQCENLYLLSDSIPAQTSPGWRAVFWCCMCLGWLLQRGLHLDMAGTRPPAGRSVVIFFISNMARRAQSRSEVQYLHWFFLNTSLFTVFAYYFFVFFFSLHSLVAWLSTVFFSFQLLFSPPVFVELNIT